MNRILILIIAGFGLMSASPTAKAEIRFEQTGSDLVMTITEPIQFQLTADFTGQYFVIRFDNPPADQNFFGSLTPTVSLPIDGSPVTIFQLGYNLNGLELDLYYFPASVSLEEGDALTLPAGVFVSENWVSLFSVIPSSPTTAYLYDATAGTDMSDVVAVPEPSRLGLLLSGCALLASIRAMRRKAASFTA